MAGVVETTFEPDGFAVGETVHNHQPDGTEASPSVFNDLSQTAWLLRRRAQGLDMDEGVVLTGDPEHGKAWRLSQAFETGTLGNAPQSPHGDFVAGETGAFNDAGRGGPTTDTFFGQFDFTSATGGPQAGLAIGAQVAAFDRRQAFVRILDDTAELGYDLVFFDTDANGAFVGTTLDLNLPYTEWHTIALDMLFLDGLNGDGTGNDVVRLFVNGVLVHTGTSWETVYVDAGLPPTAVDSLSFQASSQSGFDRIIPAHLGGGLLFDNVLVSDVSLIQDVPAPGALSLFGLGLIGLAARSRRRRTA